MFRTLAIAAGMTLLLGLPARADFADGLRAFDAGDYRATIAAWQPLADAGDADALAALAGLYLQGLGVVADAGHAAELYRQAAERGHVMAQLNLGDLYRRGLGVPRDPVEAYAWLALAAGQGHPWARRRVAEMDLALPPETLRRARALAAARSGQSAD